MAFEQNSEGYVGTDGKGVGTVCSMETGSMAREEGQEKANMGEVESPESTGGREVESHCKGQRGLLEDKTLRAATRFQPLRHHHAQKARPLFSSPLSESL